MIHAPNYITTIGTIIIKIISKRKDTQYKFIRFSLAKYQVMSKLQIRHASEFIQGEE